MPVPAAHAGARIMRSVAGYDWALPSGEPAPNNGFFSERDSADADARIELRGFDLSWRRTQPAPGGFDGDGTGGALRVVKA